MGLRSSRKGTSLEVVRAVEKRGNISCTETAERMTFAPYIDGNLLVLAVYRCSSLQDRLLHLREIMRFPRECLG